MFKQSFLLKQALTLRSDAYSVEFFRMFEHMRFRNEVQGPDLRLLENLAYSILRSGPVLSFMATKRFSKDVCFRMAVGSVCDHGAASSLCDTIPI